MILSSTMFKSCVFWCSFSLYLTIYVVPTFFSPYLCLLVLCISVCFLRIVFVSFTYDIIKIIFPFYLCLSESLNLPCQLQWLEVEIWSKNDNKSMHE